MKNKKIVILIITITSILIIILYNITKSVKKVPIQEANTGNIEKYINNEVNEKINEDYISTTTGTTEEKISPNAILVFNKTYNDCGHIVKETEIAENAIVNLSEEEIKALYYDWNIIYFSNNKIEMEKRLPGQCGEHYVVREEKGHIGVYKLDFQGKEILMKDTQIETQYLPTIDKEEIKKGVKIIGKEKLNAYLENFE